jgi:GNAT superfamily N-acetyltransferase
VTLPADLHTRRLQPADAEAILALVAACDECYTEFLPAAWTPPEVPPDWPRRFERPETWSLAAFDAAERLVGFVSFRPAHADEAPGTRSGELVPGLAHVGTVFVHPSRWRQGIAAALLGRAEAVMRERGFARAQLWTPEGAPAERFYLARGWARDGRLDWHPWMGLAVVGYAKHLASGS